MIAEHPRSTVALVVGILMVSVCYVAYAGRTDASARPKGALVVNLTSGQEDLHAVNMALELAGHGLDDGRQVILFLNVRAPEVGSKKLPPTCALAGKLPITDMLRKVIQRGGIVLCCPSCMKVVGIDEADLLPGIKLATREGLFGKLGAESVVFSY
jgi:predicted peroxiredoxin